jgi:hypothetical protein
MINAGSFGLKPIRVTIIPAHSGEIMASYLFTPGLNQYPYFERFSVWCDAYRHLKKNDLETKLRNKLFISRMLACVFFIACTGMIRLPFFNDLPIVRIGTPILLSLIGTLLGTSIILVLSFRQQNFLNKKVGEHLLERNRKKGLPLPKNAG